MNNIEVEIRSFIDDKKYQELLNFFKKNAKHIKSDYQETYYFDSDNDLRIQKGNKRSKIWLKDGKIHDEARKELEIIITNSDFKKAEELFITLGYNIEIKWFRKREQYKWDNIKVCVDDTKGYGKIIELEIMSSEKEIAKNKKILTKKIKELGIALSKKEEFTEKYSYYKSNWKRLTK